MRHSHPVSIVVTVAVAKCCQTVRKIAAARVCATNLLAVVVLWYFENVSATAGMIRGLFWSQTMWECPFGQVSTMKYSQVVSGLAVARRAKDAQSKQISEEMRESSRQSHVYIYIYIYISYIHLCHIYISTFIFHIYMHIFTSMIYLHIYIFYKYTCICNTYPSITYIHIYMYTYLHVCILHKYILHTYTDTYLQIYLFFTHLSYIRIHVCMYDKIHVWHMYICVYMCIYMYINTCTIHIHVGKFYICVQYSSLYLNIYIHLFIHAYLHVYLSTCIHIYSSTYLHKYISTYVHTYKRGSTWNSRSAING